MPKRSKIAQLPESLREYIRATLVAKSYSQYKALEAKVRELGEKLGIPADELPGKNALHRFGSDLERRLAAVKAATEGAVALAAAAPDDDAQLSGAVLSMIQTDVYNIILKLREADDADPVKRAKLLASVARDMATAGRAQIDLKRFKSEVHIKLKSAADAVARIASKGGLTKDAVAEIRNKILGVAQ